MRPLTLTLSCLLLVAGVCGQQPEAHTQASSHPSEASVPGVRLSGKKLLAVARGDYVHPALSPDGTRLAYSKVVVAGGHESTEILLRDLRSGRTSLLLGPRAADKYATYSAFVTEIEWRGNRRLRVRVSDGDVDSTDLVFDTWSGRLLREEHIPPGFDDDGSGNPLPVPPEFKRAHARARALFPAFDDRILRHTFYNGAFLAGDRGIVLQKRHANEDDHVWLLDFERRTMRTLLDLPGRSPYRLTGGLAFGPSILFVVANEADAVLYEHRDGRATRLLRIPVTSGAPAGVEIKHRSASRVVFLLRTAPSYEKGDNPLLVFDGSRLQRAADYPALHDASIDAKGRRIAFSFWKGDARHLVVGELKD